MDNVMPIQNDRDFPALNLEQLRKYAKRWVKKFAELPIEKITMYGYSSPYTSIPSRVKYCIVFDVKGEVLPKPETANSHIEKIESFNRSIYDIIDYCNTIYDQDSYLCLMDAGFPSAVYLYKPDENFKDEWIFLTRRLEEKDKGVMSKEACWVLFDRNELAQHIKKSVQSEKEKLDFENAFIHQGDAWEIWFKGKKLKPIKNLDGLTYLANLLASKPGDYIHVTNLCDSVNPQKRNAMMAKEDLTEALNKHNMIISTMQDEGLDKKGKGNLRKKLHELDNTAKDAALPEFERAEARAEYDRIVEILKVTYGKASLLPKAPKKVNESVKKDLDRAGQAIKRAYEKIRKQSPELADYLENTIHTGTQYHFTDTSTLWYIAI